MTQPKPLQCPACSAALAYDGRAEVMQCEYCGMTLVIPPQQRQDAPQWTAGDSQAEKIHEMLALVERGQKIEAIKLYRETFGTGLKESKDGVELLIAGQPTAVYHISTNVNSTAPGLGCAITSVILLFIGGIFAAIFYAERPAQTDQIIASVLAGEFEEAFGQLAATASNLNRAVYDTAVPIPNSDPINPDLLLTTWLYGGDEIPVNLSYTSYDSDTGQRQIVWEAPIGNSGDFQSAVGVSSSHAYLAVGTQLEAYNLRDGARAWQTVLSDKVSSQCEGCIQATRELVYVISADNRLEAFETRTGRSVWSWVLQRENFVAPDAGFVPFMLVGDWLLFLDDVAEVGSDKGLYLLNKETGELVRRLEPSCVDPGGFFGEEMLGHDGVVVVDENGDETTAVFFFGSTPASLCLQKWSLETGESIWQTYLPEEYSRDNSTDSGLMVTGAFNPYFVATSTDFLLPVTSSAQNYDAFVLHYDLAQGTQRGEYKGEGYSLFPAGLADGQVILRGVRERGSEQVELWGINQTTGSIWREILPGEYLFEQEPFDDRYSYRVREDGVLLLALLTDEEPALLLAQKLALDTGEQVYEERTAVNRSSFWRGLLWLDETAYLSLYELWRVDWQDGTAVVDWP
jgi:hypothetical protein